MIPQTFLVSILVATDVTLVWFGVAVGPLVPGHGRGSVGAEPAGVAHERSLVGVLEPHVFVQRCLLHRCVVTVTASKPRKDVSL